LTINLFPCRRKDSDLVAALACRNDEVISCELGNTGVPSTSPLRCPNLGAEIKIAGTRGISHRYSLKRPSSYAGAGIKMRTGGNSAILFPGTKSPSPFPGAASDHASTATFGCARESPISPDRRWVGCALPHPGRHPSGTSLFGSHTSDPRLRGGCPVPARRLRLQAWSGRPFRRWQSSC